MDIILGLPLSIIAGLIPAAIYGWFVNWLDRYEKESWWWMATAFFWGAVPAVFMAIVTQVMLDIPTTWLWAADDLRFEVASVSVWAPLTEEVFKGLGVFLIVLLARREIDSLIDGIVYGAMSGLGFAFIENILYFMGALTEEGWGSWIVVVLMRTIPFGLSHAFFTGMTGAGLAVAYLHRAKIVKIAAPLGGLAAGMLFHSVHNLGLTLAEANGLTCCFGVIFNWGGIIMLGVLIVLTWRQEKSWITAQLPDELAADMYQLITSWAIWHSTRVRALLYGKFAEWRKLGRVRRAAIELAFKKQQLARLGEDDGVHRDIARYRKQLIELGVMESRE